MEIAWAIAMKQSEGFTKPWTTAFMVVCMIVSFYFLGKAINILPIGTAYAVWTGIGAIGVAIVGIVVFSEPATWTRIVPLLMIVSGIVGLKVLNP
jgi:quaternary ammonium compound-resistance protein SugE